MTGASGRTTRPSNGAAARNAYGRGYSAAHIAAARAEAGDGSGCHRHTLYTSLRTYQLLRYGVPVQGRPRQATRR